MNIYLVLSLLAIVIQGLFAFFEMACVSFNKVRLQYYVSIGTRRAIWLEYLLKRPSRLFGTTLIGITTSLVIGSECARRFYESMNLNPDWAPLTQVPLVVIFGELAPMFAARRHPEQSAMFCVPLMILLARILTNLKLGDVLFIDEIHRMPKAAEEYLYSAMEDFSLDLLIDTGPNARTVQVKLNPFTLVGATTRSGLLSAPMRSRFLISLRLDYYEPPALKQIIKRSGSILNMDLSNEAALEIANRSRGTPRIANNLLRWVRDFSQIQKQKSIDRLLVRKALDMLAIDEKGLDEMDKKILSVIIDHHDGGPVGLNNLAVACGEESHTIEEVYEPFLTLQGMIKRTPRGRVATAAAYEHLGRKPKKIPESLQ